MAPRRRVSRKTNSAAGHRKGATHGRRFHGLIPVIALLLIGGIVAGTLVFRGGHEGTAEPRPLSVLHTEDYHSLAFSSDDPRVVFFGHHNGIMRSDDGGKTWRRLIERRNFDAMGLVISRRDSRTLFLAGHDIFQVSQDGGATWRSVENNLPDTDMHGFAVSPEGDFFAFVVGYGLFRSSDSGRNWVRIGTQLPDDTIALAVAGGNPLTLYAGGVRTGMLKSTDGGQHWVPVGTLRSGGVAAIVVDPQSPKTVYAGGESGLYKSTDAGDSWTRPAFPRGSVMVLAISPAQPGLILAINVLNGEGQVFQSADGGLTWGE